MTLVGRKWDGERGTKKRQGGCDDGGEFPRVQTGGPPRARLAVRGRGDDALLLRPVIL